MSNFQLYKKAISATGTTTENEPIIKSDGDGEVMQWIPSDGVVADGITIDEPGAGNPLRLGIGTISPDGSLDIEKTINTAWSSALRANDFLQISNLSTTSGAYSGIELIATGTGSAGAAEIVCADSGSGSGDLVFSTRNSSTWGEKMRIDSAGKVGIGCTPSYPLAVEADGVKCQLRETNAAKSATVSFVNSGSTASFNDVAAIEAGIDSGAAKGFLSFGTRQADAGGETVEALRIGSTGLATFSNGIAVSTGDVKLGSSSYGNKKIFAAPLPNSGLSHGASYTFNFSFTFSGSYGAALITLDLACGIGQVCAARYTFFVTSTADSGLTTQLAGTTTTVFEHNMTNFTFADSGATDNTFTISVDRDAGVENWASWSSYSIDATVNNLRDLTLNSVTAS